MPDDTRQVCQKHESLEVSLTRIERTAREGFAEVNGSLRAVLADLREGAVEIATMKLRILMLERLVFGSVALALSGFGVALFNLILKR